MQRFLAILLILAGLGGAGYGVATATVLRESDTVVATATPSGDGTMLVTVPGVLGMVDESVTVRASVPEGQKVTLAIGTETDVLGWVGDDPYDSVTGMADWSELSVVPGAGVSEGGEGAEEGDDAEPAERPSSGPDPAGSDMWISEVSGETSVSLRYTDQPGPYVLLAAGVGRGAEAPTVELTWPRPVTTPYLWPGVIGGGFLVLVGLFLFVGARRKPGGRKSKASGKGRKSARTVREPLEPRNDGSHPGGPEESPYSPAPGEKLDAPFPPGPAEQSPFPLTDEDQDAEQSGAPFPPATAPAWGSAPTAPPYEAPSEPEHDTVPRPAPAAPAAPAAAGVWGSGRSEPTFPSGPTEHPGAHQAPAGPPAPGSLRRRRGRRGAPDPAATPPAAPMPPAPMPAPAAPAPAAPAPAAARPQAAASSGSSGTPGKLMTRRERRLAEQAARRGNTGMQPAVPQQQPEPPQPEPPQPGPPASSRAAAWREAWGIKDGENR
ncbi:hypothetical protein [Myceligenerans pegani]|uniref:Uncharacterized protein n=1 Tax=Myceligenerans pegani TaxID=2776917 RepID=A0ABR9MYR8_9MICO|nr:hypothetical protein [Myceligenerans sp. TRM 65318]MBE1875932.1 hypothetical protein [Myceligenerans sp. TRM 65318]MBE3018203.1 hypothetical protein [Myceligenerans sp. TRM 65318]